MAIKFSLFRLAQSPQYRAVDTTALLIIMALLQSTELTYSDFTNLVDKYEMLLMGQSKSTCHLLKEDLSFI